MAKALAKLFAPDIPETGPTSFGNQFGGQALSDIGQGTEGAQNGATLQRLTKTLNPEERRKIIFGETYAPCDVRYWEAYNDSKNYDEIIVVATHKIYAFGTTFTYGSQSLIFDGSGNETGDYGTKMNLKTRTVGVLGSTLACGAGSIWTNTDTLFGCAFYSIRTVFDKNLFPDGLENKYGFITKGAYVYDPRLDTSVGGTGDHRADDQDTWEYVNGGTDIGRNPVLQELWYLLGWRINGKVVAGMGVPPEDINYASFIAAANAADAEGYFGDLVLSTGDDHDRNLSIIRSSCGGILTDAGGLYSFHVATDDTASIAVNLSESDFAGPHDWVEKVKMKQQFNSVVGSFPDPASNFMMRPYPPEEDGTYVTADGYDRPKTIDYQTIKDDEQIQKLNRIKLNQTRYQGVFTVPMQWKALQCKHWDVIELSFDLLAWTNKKFRVIRQGITTDGQIKLTLQETDASIYTGVTATPYPAPSTGTEWDIYAGELVTTLDTTPVTETGDIGSASDALQVDWDAPSPLVAFTEVQYKRNSESNWITGPTLQDGENVTILSPLESATLYDVRARHTTKIGVVGTWASVSDTTGNNRDTAIGASAGPDYSFESGTAGAYDDALGWFYEGQHIVASPSTAERLKHYADPLTGGGATSYGAASAVNGPSSEATGHWKIGKRFTIENDGGDLTVNVRMWLLSGTTVGRLAADPIAGTETWVAEDDAYIKLRYYDAAGAQIGSDVDSTTASEQDYQINSDRSISGLDLPLTFTDTAPTNAFRIEVLLCATDGSGTVQTKGFDGANAAVKFDNFTIRYDHGIVEVGDQNWAAEPGATLGAIWGNNISDPDSIMPEDLATMSGNDGFVSDPNFEKTDANGGLFGLTKFWASGDFGTVVIDPTGGEHGQPNLKMSGDAGANSVTCASLPVIAVKADDRIAVRIRFKAEAAITGTEFSVRLSQRDASGTFIGSVVLIDGNTDGYVTGSFVTLEASGLIALAATESGTVYVNLENSVGAADDVWIDQIQAWKLPNLADNTVQEWDDVNDLNITRPDDNANSSGLDGFIVDSNFIKTYNGGSALFGTTRWWDRSNGTDTIMHATAGKNGQPALRMQGNGATNTNCAEQTRIPVKQGDVIVVQISLKAEAAFNTAGEFTVNIAERDKDQNSLVNYGIIDPLSPGYSSASWVVLEAYHTIVGSTTEFANVFIRVASAMSSADQIWIDNVQAWKVPSASDNRFVAGSVASGAGGLLPNWNFSLEDEEGKPAGILMVEGISNRNSLSFGDINKNTILIDDTASDNTVAYGFPAIPIDDKQSYTITIRHKSSTTNNGLYLRMNELNTFLPTGTTHIGTSGVGGATAIRTSRAGDGGGGSLNPAQELVDMPGTSWVEDTIVYTPTPGVKFASFGMYNWNALSTDYEVDFVSIHAGVDEATLDALNLLNGPAEAGADVTLDHEAAPGINLNRGAATNDLTRWFTTVSASTDLTSDGAHSIVDVGAGGNYGTEALQTLSDGNRPIFSEHIPIDVTRTYRVSVWVRQTAGTRVQYLLCAFLDENGDNIQASTGGATGWDNHGTYHYYGLWGQVGPGSWTLYSMTFGPEGTATIPAAAKSLSIGALANQSGSGSTTVQFQRMRVEELEDALGLPNGPAEANATEGADYFNNLDRIPDHAPGALDDPEFKLQTIAGLTEGSFWDFSSAPVSLATITVHGAPASDARTNAIEFDLDGNELTAKIMDGSGVEREFIVGTGDVISIRATVAHDGLLTATGSVSNGLHIYIQEYEEDGTTLTSGDGYVIETDEAANTWFDLHYSYKTIHYKCSYVTIRLVIPLASSAAGTWWCSYVQATTMGGGEALTNNTAVQAHRSSLDDVLFDLHTDAGMDQGDASMRRIPNGLMRGYASDGDSFTFVPPFDVAPTIVFFSGGLVYDGTSGRTLSGANSWMQNFQAITLTNTGFSAYLKLEETAGTPTDRTITGDTPVAGYDWEGNKDLATEAWDNNYTFTYDITVYSGSYESELGAYLTASATVGFYANNGGGWVEIDTTYHTSGGANPSSAYTDQTYVVNVSGMGLNTDFAMDIIAYNGTLAPIFTGGVDADYYVAYEEGTTGTAISATGAGVSKIPFLVFNNDDGGSVDLDP